MEFTFYLYVIAVFIASVVSWPVKRQSGPDLSNLVPSDGLWAASFAPDLGFVNERIDPDEFDQCIGPLTSPNGIPIRIPCECPPSQADFQRTLAANIDAGYIMGNPDLPFYFPVINDGSASDLARLQACIDTLETTMSCPVESTTLGEQLAHLSEQQPGPEPEV